jgi:hypothetical protein
MLTMDYSSTKERWFAVITVIVAIVTSLAAFELGLRLFPPTWLKSRMELVSSGKAAFGTDHGFPRRVKIGKFWGYEPNSEFLVASDEFLSTAHIDELGGRKVHYVERTDKSRPVLPFLGDSFTFGVGVSDEETFASTLSGEIQQLRILNLGNPGTALDQQRKTIALRHAELGSPKKYVFFFFMGNDFVDLMNPAGGGRSLDMFLHLSQFVRHNDILRQLYLIQFARAPLLQFLRPRQHFSASGARKDVSVWTQADFVDAFGNALLRLMNVVDDEYLNRARAALDSELDGLAQMQREYGFSSLIVAIPDRLQINDKLRQMKVAKNNYGDATLDPSRPNLLLRTSVAAAGISFFDATSCLRTAAGPSTLYYNIDDHFTAFGHRTFARCVAPELKRFLQD